MVEFAPRASGLLQQLAYGGAAELLFEAERI
jgi:hypothetical protein